MVLWFGKWETKKVAKTITSLKGKYNVGSADKIKSKASKAKLDAAKSSLKRTFSKTDESLKKLKRYQLPNLVFQKVKI